MGFRPGCVKVGTPVETVIAHNKIINQFFYISRMFLLVTANINIQSLINRGIGPRQRSMPVQIDSDLIRIIPKHLRKRVKSAEISKKKMN